MALQIRRGTDAQRQGITPKAGEPIFTTDTNKLYIGDGTTAGGLAERLVSFASYLPAPFDACVSADTY